jgi:hypothetical protein
VKVHIQIQDDAGNNLVEPKWYAGNVAAALLSHVIPQLHGQSAPLIGVDPAEVAEWPVYQKILAQAS